ncbi:MAG TPA: hypothetical protein VH583_21725 [Vicinamibacterales bacterium]|jgi:hypothetical protein
MTTTARTLLILPLICISLVAAPAFADQQHVLNSRQLTDTMEGKAELEAADRATIKAVLAKPDVQKVAETIGVDMDRIKGAVDTMSGSDLHQAAEAARQVDSQLVGGASTVVLSTTTIIIILLAIILIVVIAK